MRCIVAGHTYLVPNFNNPDTTQTIQFIHKEPKEPGSDELTTVNDGTTNEELIAVLINRITFLQEKFPCKENEQCITHLQEGLHWLESRTAARLKRGVEGMHKA
mgnify:CR=1 FL=1